MKFLVFLFQLFLLYPIALICISCGQENNVKEEGDLLITSTLQLQTDLNRLSMMTDSLWDTTSFTLNQLLPSDFPSIDRKLLLEARNADHIQMFMSYTSLPPEVQSFVQQAGHQDSLLSVKMLSLQTQINTLQKARISFLAKMAKTHPDLYQYYADQFKAIDKPKSY